MVTDYPRRKPLPTSNSSYTSQSQVLPGHYEMAPFVPAGTQDNYHHSFEPSGYSPSQHSTHDILQPPTPYTGVDSAYEYGTGESKPAFEAHVEQINPNRRPWNTKWLSAVTLILFALASSAFLAALLVIYTLSQRSNGFEAGTRSTRYVWKYIPIAVILIVSALWDRMFYFVRLLSPWQNLKKGPASVDKSLILDYISPAGPVVIFDSLKNKDWAVATIGTGALLLKLASVISTGLFTLRLTDIIAQTVPMSSPSKFGASTYNASLSTLKAASTFYSIQTYNMTYPDWTTDTMAIQPFELVNRELFPSNATLSSEVLAFLPSFECETGTVTFAQPEKSSQDGSFNATVEVPNCKVTVPLTAVDSTEAFTYRSSGGYPTTNYVSYVREISCFDGEQGDRILLTVSKANKTLQINEISAIVCRPSHSIQLSTVTFNLALAGTDKSLRVEPVKDSPKYLLDGLNSMALYNAVNANIGNLMLSTNKPPKMSEYIFGMFGPMGALAGKREDNSTLGQFLNATFMTEMAQQTFNGIASQLARQDFLDAADSLHTGTVRYQQNRVWANKVSVLVLSVIMVFLVAILLLLQFLKPWDVVPRSPDTIFATVAILNNSTAIKQSLEGTGSYQISDIQAKLRRRHFQSRFTSNSGNSLGFRVDELANNTPETETTSQPTSSALKPWRPFVITTRAAVAATAFPLLILIMLEVVQRISDRSHGFLDVDNRQSNAYAMAFVPAIILTAVALLEGSISSTTAIVAVFWRLKAGNAPASSTIFHNTVGDLFHVAIWKSLKTRHWAIVFINIAAGFAAFLTLFTAELYTIQGVAKFSAINLNRADGFNLTHTFRKQVNDDGAGLVTGLVLGSNLTYPIWTYDNLVFPAMTLGSELSNLSNRSEGLITARVPAIRGSLNCTVTLPSQANQGSTLEVGEIMGLNIAANFPNTCPGEDGALNRFNITSYASNSEKSGFLGGILDVNTITNINGTFHVGLGKTESNIGWPDLDVGCPSLVTYFGDYQLSASGSVQDSRVTVLVCTQLIQQIDTDVTFANLDFEIDTTHPPIPIESTAIYLKNDLADSFVRQYQLYFGLLGLGLDYSRFGPFYDVAVDGLNGTPISELLGAENADKLVEVTNHLYGQYMAQAISINMRTTNPTLIASSPPIQTALLQHQTLRITQNKTLKLILQILLALIVVCNVLTWFFTGDTKDLLYHPPCSIAGTASLLAGSELWAEGFLPGDVAFEGEEGREEGMVHGWLFGLGWWTDRGRERGRMGGSEQAGKRFGIDFGKAE